MTERSPELLALEAKYAELMRTNPPRNTSEPRSRGRMIAEHIKHSEKVVQDFKPLGICKPR